VAPIVSLPGVPAVPVTESAAGLPEGMPVRQVLTMVATAYDPGPASTGKRPGDPGYGITATGMRAGYGVVAVDPRVVPFFTRLYIPGYGYAVAADTGSAIVGHRIDLGFATHGEAIQWGRRTVPVYVLG
jgi:3D (Asp-Asp-Asp) domain-containing protein